MWKSTIKGVIAMPKMLVSIHEISSHPTLFIDPDQFPCSSAAYANAKMPVSNSSQCYILSISHTRLYIPIIRIATSPSPILSSTLRTTHPSTLWHGSTTPPLLHGRRPTTPPLLHRRRPGLVTSWLSGSAAASGDAA